MGTATKAMQYHYDSVGNRSGLTDPDGGRFTYAYDSVRRITHLENPQNERTSYAYDAAGRRTLKQLANGTRGSFSYDDASNLTRLANLKSDGTTISAFDYGYDKTGNRTAVREANGSRVTYAYDNTYQLTGENRTGSNAYRNTFTYDAAGNRTLKNESGQRTTYAYDAANQLKTAQAALGTTSYTFDADGNQQIVQPPTGNRTTTTWDYENRTTLVQLASGLRNTMAYEPDGLRVKLEDSTGTRKFIWDDQNYLAETDENDDTQVVYTNEPVFYGVLPGTSWEASDLTGVSGGVRLRFFGAVDAGHSQVALRPPVGVGLGLARGQRAVGRGAEAGDHCPGVRRPEGDLSRMWGGVSAARSRRGADLAASGHHAV
jgi:YD repeat-containing protein